MKKQFLLLIAIMMATCGYAQSFWWGYFTESMANEMSYSGRLGYGQATAIDAAIYIPANHSIVGNGTIKALRFWLGDDISKINSDITVWISSTLPSSAQTADYHQAIPKSKVVTRLNEVELTTPFNINNQGFYVGFSFSISGQSYPIMSYSYDNIENTFFYRIGNGNWIDFPAEEYNYGLLALQMQIDGVTLPSYSVSVVPDFKTTYALMGTQAPIAINLTNEGSETITSLSYTITTDGNTSDEKTVSILDLPMFESASINFLFNADSETKRYSKALTITKVNGQPNTAANNTASGSMITISEKPVPVPVIEEFTGTWCGWCVYGYTGMEKTYETFGDQVVLIAAHNDDPMETSDYNPIMALVSSFPSSFINRGIDEYPSASELNYWVKQMLNRTTIGSIQAKAMWTSDAKTEISIDTDTKFVYNDDNGQYGIAYVLTEDGMSGTGSAWAQSNYLSGDSGNEGMEFWEQSPSKVTGLKFNFVAVGAWNIADGVEGSVNGNFKAGEVQHYNFKADISSKSIIQDKSKLKVAALLIDQSTGNIVNAAQVAIQDYDPTAIKDLHSTNATEAARYTLDGRQVSASQRGLNIIRLSDGTVRKVIVK
jgi:hypothetical protein